MRTAACSPKGPKIWRRTCRKGANMMATAPANLFIQNKNRSVAFLIFAQLTESLLTRKSKNLTKAYCFPPFLAGVTTVSQETLITVARTAIDAQAACARTRVQLRANVHANMYIVKKDHGDRKRRRRRHILVLQIQHVLNHPGPALIHN